MTWRFRIRGLRAARSVLVVFAAVLCVAASGCAGGTGGAVGGDETDSLRAEGEPLRFAIELESSDAGPVFVLISDEDGQPGWIQVFRGAERVYLRERCEIEDCARRGVVCGASVPMVQGVARGDAAGSVEYLWDGTTSVVSPSTGCETRQRAPAGLYVARFCFANEASFESGGELGVARAGRLVEQTCTDVSFTLLDREVVLRM